MAITFWLTVLSLVVGILAFVGTSPFWIKLFLRHFYSSEITMQLSKMQPEHQVIEAGDNISYSDIPYLRLGISNNKKKRLKYGIAIYSYHRMELDGDLSDGFGNMDTVDKTPFSAVNKPEGTRYQVLARNGYIEELSSVSYNLPLSTPGVNYGPESKTKFGVAIIPEVSLSTLSIGGISLPDFFDNAKLKPIVTEYVIEYSKPNTIESKEVTYTTE